MRFSKRSLLILGIGIPVVILAVLFSNYAKEIRKRESLFAEIARVQKAVPKIAAEKGSLEPQLVQLEEKLTLTKQVLDRTKWRYPTSVESIDYAMELTDLADDCALTVVNLTSSEATKTTDVGITYLTTNFTIEVKGTIDNLLDFIHTIAQGTSFACTSIDTLDMSEMNEADTEPSLRISLMAYSYKGD